MLKRHGRGVSPSTRCPSVSATQKRIAPLELLQQIFGGAIRPAGKGGAYYVWEVNSRASVQQTIKLVLPYLVLKQREAQIVYEYTRLMGFRGRIMDDQIISDRLALITRMEAERA